MKGSLLIEIHGWRGFRADKDLFSYECRLGFVSFFLSKDLVSESLADIRRKLDELKRLLQSRG